jgi:4-azaleucine resistance transporter AzlC
MEAIIASFPEVAFSCDCAIVFAINSCLFELTNDGVAFIIANMSAIHKTMDTAVGRDVALVCAANAIVGASFGAISVSGGLPLWVPVVMSLAVFAGGAQFAAVGIVLAGGGPAAGVLAGLVLNLRLLAYGFAVRDLVQGAWWKRLLGAHLTMDEAVAFALRQTDPVRRRAAFWLCGIALFVSWNVAVALGGWAGEAIGDPGALGLDAAFPAVLLALVLPALRDRRTRNASLTGAAAALCATPFLPAGLSVLAALVGLLPGIVRSRRCR